jgi:plastocyanin
MPIKWVTLAVFVLAMAMWTISTALQAQVRGNDANVTMMDDCSTTDAGYDAFGGCPEGAPFPGFKSYKGDVSAPEFFALLFSPLTAPGHVIGHPSWRNEPSYISIRSGQTLRVTNRGGRSHSFTAVQHYGGGFVPPLNGTMTPAPECNPGEVEVLHHGEAQRLEGLAPGLHKFQCCIHPWMRGSVRVN